MLQWLQVIREERKKEVEEREKDMETREGERGGEIGRRWRRSE